MFNVECVAKSMKIKSISFLLLWEKVFMFSFVLHRKNKRNLSKISCERNGRETERKTENSLFPVPWKPFFHVMKKGKSDKLLFGFETLGTFSKAVKWGEGIFNPFETVKLKQNEYFEAETRTFAQGDCLCGQFLISPKTFFLLQDEGGVDEKKKNRAGLTYFLMLFSELLILEWNNFAEEVSEASELLFVRSEMSSPTTELSFFTLYDFIPRETQNLNETEVSTESSLIHDWWVM